MAEYAGHDPKALLETYAKAMPNDSGTVAAAINPVFRPDYAQEVSALQYSLLLGGLSHVR